MKDLVPYTEAPPPQSEAYLANQQQDEGPGLIEYWRILRRRKGTLILISFLGLLTALLVTLPQTPVYQAKATLEIQNLNDNFLNMKQVSQVDEGTSNQLNDIQTQIKILQSNTLTERTLAKLDKNAKPSTEEEPGRVSAWRKALNLAPPQKPSQSETVASAASNLKVRAAGQTRIIEVLYDSTDPRRAALFVNTLVNEYIDQNLEARWQMSQRTGEWLSKQLDEMRAKLEQSEDRLQSYARQAGLLFTNDKSSVSEERLRQVQEEFSKAQGDRISRQSRFELARSSPPETLADVLNDSSLRDYQVKLAELRRQEAELATTYTPQHAKVKRVAAEIASLDLALQRERANIIKRISNDYDEAQRREKLLAANYADQFRLVTDQGEKAVQYNILKREVDSNRSLYDAMLQRVKESAIASAIRASNVRIVDAAQSPRLPYKPSVPLNSALGLMAGGFLGVAFVVMRERADRTLQEPGDAQFYLNVPELGVIPSADSTQSRRLYYLKRRPQVVAPSSSEPPVARASARVELVTFQKKPSIVAESFRTVLTSILFSGQNGTRPKVLVLTSANPKEGKSTVTSNLAIALAEIHKKVLIIDADLRRPRIHEIFGVPNEVGLTDLLMGTVEKPLVHATQVPNLFILPAGPSTSAAANLLHADQLPALLKEFRAEFDMVLIDTPPMLQMPDARVVGSLADTVILVTRAGHTTRDAALAARQRLADDNTKVLGVILNDWNPKSSPGGYYGYYKGYGSYYKGYSHYYNHSDPSTPLQQ